jgi:hypothetical protein
VDIELKITFKLGKKEKKKEKKKKGKTDYLVTGSLIIHKLPHFPEFRPIWAHVAT